MGPQPHSPPAHRPGHAASTGLAAGTCERTVTFVSWKAEDTRMDVVVVLRVVP